MIQGFELTPDYIQFFDKAANWEEAVRLSADPLLKGGEITQGYIDGMIQSVKDHGPYIVIAPDIALPHARPETGSLRIGFSFMKLEEAVAFEADGSANAKLFIALSCVDADTHLEMLQSIVLVLSDQEKQDALFAATTKEEVMHIFNA